MNIVKQGPQTIQKQKQGRYDKLCEIFREGEFINGFLSMLQPGDCFRTMEKPDKWLGVTSGIRIVPNRREPMNPNIEFDGLHVMQAAPTKDTTQKIEEKKPKAVPLIDSVEDVDFKEL